MAPESESWLDADSTQPELFPDELHEALVVAFGERAHAPPRARVVRDRGTRGRTVECVFADGPAVYAKHYPTEAEARRSHHVLHGLWSGSFGPRTSHRVPRPVAFLPHLRLVASEVAPGLALSAAAAGPSRHWEAGVRAAAAWLARLHRGAATGWVGADTARRPHERLTSRAKIVVANDPARAFEVEALMKALDARRPEADDLPSALTHGRFHPDHVFVAADAVTVIDLDRAAPGDPARDVGEMVHRLQATVARALPAHARRERCTASVEAFLTEYTTRSGTALPTLAHQWSFAVLWHLFGSMAKGRSEHRLDQFRQEFDEIPDRLRSLAESSG